MEELDHLAGCDKICCPKIDNGGDTGMSFGAIYYHKTYKKSTRFSSLYIVIRTHCYISTAINFQTTKFGHNLLHDPLIQQK